MRNCVMVARQTLTLFVWVQILVPQPEDKLRLDLSELIFPNYIKGGMQRSLVARFVRDEEAAGSNPVIPTSPSVHMDTRIFFNFRYEHRYQGLHPRQFAHLTLVGGVLFCARASSGYLFRQCFPYQRTNFDTKTAFHFWRAVFASMPGKPWYYWLSGLFPV